jgi:sulfite reductase (ferredoxin)
MTDAPKEKKLSAQEGYKKNSNYLRGNITKELTDTSNLEVTDETYELLKFHGSYFGYDRDTQTERKKAGLDKEWEFMLRMKCPGGKLRADQYLSLDRICEHFANGTLRITTRQTFQFHQILKPEMRPMVRAIIEAELSTLGGCGDVNRNVLACPAPIKDEAHKVMQDTADKLAEHFSPKANAYLEVWMDEEKLDLGTPEEVEPIYKDVYMPRKFKIAINEPHDNCVDTMINDLALLPMFENGQNGKETLQGWNIGVGGGLGAKHNQPETYPRAASLLGSCGPNDVVAASQAIVELQRDHGDRSNRQHARLKYVVEEQGLDWTRTTAEKYFGKKFGEIIPIKKWGIEDHVGWYEQGDGKWFLGLFISSGRIANNYREGIREVVKKYGMDIRLTADQNIIFCDIEAGAKADIEAILKSYEIKLGLEVSNIDRWTLACVALPTCGKALAEAERIRDPLLRNIEKVLDKHDLSDEKMTFRIAGCPNGCSRPYIGDFSIVGRMPGHYKLFVGGDFEGTKLGAEIFDKVPLEDVPAALEPMFALFKANKKLDEGFGDFITRYGIAAVKDNAKAALTGKKWAA